MYPEEEVQKLHQARMNYLRDASERRDADALMTWYTKNNPIFHNKMDGTSIEGWDAIRDFYRYAYAAVPVFKIQPVDFTGPTPEFCASEMKCQGQMAAGLPGTDQKGGGVMNLTGVSLFKWRWEGSEGGWDGSLSEEAVRGWKIVDERAYFSPDKVPVT